MKDDTLNFIDLDKTASLDKTLVADAKPSAEEAAREDELMFKGEISEETAILTELAAELEDMTDTVKLDEELDNRPAQREPDGAQAGLSDADDSEEYEARTNILGHWLRARASRILQT